MSHETSEENTDLSQNSQAPQSRVYTQDEVDGMIAGMKANLQKKLLKPYEGLGDPAELRALREQAERQQQEQAMKRGEFERLLQEQAAKKDAEIQKRDQIIREYRVDTPLVAAAARHRSVNPEQVRHLLRPFVRVTEDGDTEIVDERGQVRYDDAGRPLAVDTFVERWLQENPHFVAATPATTQGRSVISTGRDALDVSKLDMNNAEHRKIYAEYRKNRRP